MAKYKIEITVDWIVEEEDDQSAQELAQAYASSFSDIVMQDSTVTGEPVWLLGGSANSERSNYVE